MTSRASHWDAVYGRKAETEMSWHEDMPGPSLRLIRAHAPKGASIIDIGAGTSRLTETLAREGYGPLAVLDISGAALALDRQRLGGQAAAGIQWIAADVTAWVPDRTWQVWHDRAVFHFLTEAQDQAAYVRSLCRALAPGGTAIIATFSDTGPERCSGLPVCRYAPEDLAARLSALAPGRFAPLAAQRHDHQTPGGAVQAFQYSAFHFHG